jgi:D-xylose transport system substrate-binding protein
MRKFAMTPGMLAAILLAVTLLLAGCKSVTAPDAAAPEAAATEAATAEAAPPAAPAAAPAGTCTPGAGSIAVLLPESETPRWEMDDRRYLEGVLSGAGVSYTIANAQGDPALQLAQAQEALVEGAKVLILTGIDSDTGAAVIAEARAAGASVIDYDRLTVTGPGADLYVSFDNFAVGHLMAQTLEPLINGLGTAAPRVVQLNGDPGDNNSALVRAGYSSIATPFYSDGRWHLVADQAVPGWSAAEADVIFGQILAEAGEEGVDAVFAANDVLAGAVVRVLKTQNAAPVLLSGQDATVEGLQNILAGWQTMTVYKPILQEAAAAGVAALAMLHCEADTLMPTTVINNGERDIPSILLDPVAVTKDNIAATVIADKFRTWDELCVGEYEQFCPAER